MTNEAMTAVDLVHQCLRHGHIMTEWGPYEAASPKLTGDFADHPPTEPSKLLAYRERGCRRCGVVEREDYYGENRKVVSDPFGIAKALSRLGDSAVLNSTTTHSR